MIVGEPGTGKSQLVLTYIKSIKTISQNLGIEIDHLKLGGKPLLVNNLDSLKFFNDLEHDCILFDDVNWKTVENREILIKLIDSVDASTFSVKHGSIQIPAKIPRFIVSNFSLEEYLKDRTDINFCNAINRRYMKIELEKGIKLFSEKLNNEETK